MSKIKANPAKCFPELHPRPRDIIAQTGLKHLFSWLFSNQQLHNMQIWRLLPNSLLVHFHHNLQLYMHFFYADNCSWEVWVYPVTFMWFTLPVVACFTAFLSPGFQLPLPPPLLDQNIPPPPPKNQRVLFCMPPSSPLTHKPSSVSFTSIFPGIAATMEWHSLHAFPKN